MGAIGDSLTQPLPAVADAGPTWASTLLTWAAEVEARLEAKLDSGSLLLTTGDVKHGTRYLQLGAAAGQSATATWTPGTGSTAGYWLGAGASDTVEFALPMERNQRITAVRMTGRSVATAWTFKLWKIDYSAGTRTQIGATKTSGTSTSIEELAITDDGSGTGMAETVANNISYVAEWTSGAALTRCLAVEVEYDRAVAT